MKRYTIYGPPTFVDGTLVPTDPVQLTCAGMEVEEGALQFYNEVTKHFPNGKAYGANEFFMIIAQGQWTKVDIQHLHEQAPQAVDEEFPMNGPIVNVDHYEPEIGVLDEIDEPAQGQSAPESV